MDREEITKKVQETAMSIGFWWKPEQAKTFIENLKAEGIELIDTGGY